MSPAIWEGLTNVLEKAIPVLESQSIAWKSPTPSPNYETQSSSNLIAYNYFSLVKDIERVNDLCIIARNLLATTRRAQNLAAEKGFDQRILALIDTCVRVTVRAFDGGEANARNEDRWQKVVSLYKRLLITCLQFLHNFIMHNEQRKLVLWLDLFGYQSNADSKIITQKDPLDPDAKPQGVAPVVKTGERIVDPPIRALYDQTAEDLLLETLSNFPREPSTIREEAAMLLLANIKEHMEKLLGRDLTEIQEMGKNPEQVREIKAALTTILGAKVDGWADLKERAQDLPRTLPARDEPKRQPILAIDRSATAKYPRICWADFPDLEKHNALATGDAPVTEEDMSMPRSAHTAAGTLQEAKDELLARLQETSQIIGDGDHHYDPDDDTAGSDIRSMDAEADESMEEDEEDDDDEDEDDDYRSRPGGHQRGLLTDIPLILGPSEIEALPMIIQAGIVDSFGLKGGEQQGSRNMQAVRCHILLTQETGRNLLRELLIFIAAWDLPDEDLYVKMMVQIMEAILKNGLMSHAYSDFGLPKDIISPAQAVLMKILTLIFRNKYSPTATSNNNGQQQANTKPPAPLTKVDVLTVRYIFTIFRGNIIPETCALIYLQGQIRAGRALPDDFPLNLWDMERVYEGVHQFLEFFAVLTENNDWKNLLVKWEIVYDLVTLIKELDASIPKGGLTTNPGRWDRTRTYGRSYNLPSKEEQSSEQEQQKDNQPQQNRPVAVERPYDPSDTEPMDTEHGNGRYHTDSPQITEDPSAFEWRNLKKLVVLVLSSLVWKCPEVQDQIRKYGGVETILSCTQFDSYNPYIKEHAVMCLKFLLEGNPENQKLIEELEARKVVEDKSGVLEKNGLEAVIDATGKLNIQQKKS